MKTMRTVAATGRSKLTLLTGLLLLASSALDGQRNLSGTPEIELALKRLNTVGSALLIAAHPDDENTALLAYFARGRHLRTGYLSLTRGEGGQNLIGAEQGDLLGVIRTEELLAARQIDGAEQFFTRAIDFGFSKTADESFAKWGHEKILADVVWTIRRFRPDVIVLRFSGTPRDGHGHHQASAILGKEAFSAAADPTRFPEQLQLVEPWQAKHLYFNVFTFNAEQEKEVSAVGKLTIELGDFDPILGRSYSEIAGMSRSMHRSQGMGAPERRGSVKNFLISIAGDTPKSDPLEGTDTTWARLPNGAAIGELLDEAIRTFRPEAPEKTIPILLKARPLIAATAGPYGKSKLVELDTTIALCAGLWLDVSAARYTASPTESLKLSVTALNRSHTPVLLTGIELEGAPGAPAIDVEPSVLVYNQAATYSMDWKIAPDQPFTQPYWLQLPKEGNTYSVARQQDIGLAKAPSVLQAHFRLRLNAQGLAGIRDSQEIEVIRPVEHRYVERVRGELTRPLQVVPPVEIELARTSLIFTSPVSKKVEVPVRSNVSAASGEIRLDAPEGWQVEPKQQKFQLSSRGELTVLAFEVTPPQADSHGELKAIAVIGDRTVSAGMQSLDYNHIPPQAIFPTAAATVVRADVKTLAKKVGYVMGAGDDVPAALNQFGVEVTMLSGDDLARADLSAFDAIVTGVRAYNVRADLRANQPRLLEYVRNGGTLLVQYNVLEGGFGGGDPHLLDKIGPFPIKIGRERVTVEDCAVSLPNPRHPLLNIPNKITAADFSGWIQERALYVATEFDPQYQSLFESHDPGESPLPGGMLFAKYGKGVYIFSAYVWFRELPAGVPGAYRIFANLLSASKSMAAAQ